MATEEEMVSWQNGMRKDRGNRRAFGLLCNVSSLGQEQDDLKVRYGIKIQNYH